MHVLGVVDTQSSDDRAELLWGTGRDVHGVGIGKANGEGVCQGEQTGDVVPEGEGWQPRLWPRTMHAIT